MLNLYRRHREEGKCAGGHPVNSRTYESDEQRRKWKKCACPIYVSGTLAGAFKRKNLETCAWEQAKPLALALEAANSWDGSLPIAQNCSESPVSATEPDAHGKTVREAVEAFLADHAKHSQSSTTRAYRCLLETFCDYAEINLHIDLKVIGPAFIRDFRDSWKVKRSTMVKNMATLKAFFEFCLSQEWLDRNPARLVKNPRGGEKEDTQKLPFTDEEIQKMLTASVSQYGRQLVKWDRRVHHSEAVNAVSEYARKWNGEDLADFILLSVHTGLRISDVVTFHIDRINPEGVCRIRAKKNGAWVYTKLPAWLVERIEARSERVGPFIFGESKAVSIDHKTNLWRRRLKDLWALCGPWTAPPTPHRFRHTFARILLQIGTPVADVADLMGDTEKTVRKHYAAWVTERQDRLTAIMEKAAKYLPMPADLRKEEVPTLM